MSLTESALIVVKVVPPTEYVQLFVDWVLSLDASLRTIFWWFWIALLQWLLNFFGLLGQQGVTWFEFSPWVFYLFWLPSMVARYFGWIWWFWAWVMWALSKLWEHVIGRTTLGWLLELAAAWLYRGTLAPPPVLQADVPPRLSLDKGENRSHVLGMGFADEAKVVHASATAGGLTPSRHRKRSVWTNRLQAYLGGRGGTVGRLVTRRWVPDLPSADLPGPANALLGLLDCEAKLLGGGVMPTTGDEHEVFLVVETMKGRLVICPELLASLTLYACFRPRTQELLAGLRSRAREWFATKGIPASAAVFALPDTVVASFAETAPERLARERLVVEEDSPSL